VLKLFIQKGAKADQVDVYGRACLDRVKEYQENEDLMKELNSIFSVPAPSSDDLAELMKKLEMNSSHPNGSLYGTKHLTP